MTWDKLQPVHPRNPTSPNQLNIKRVATYNMSSAVSRFKNTGSKRFEAIQDPIWPPRNTATSKCHYDIVKDSKSVSDNLAICPESPETELAKINRLQAAAIFAACPSAANIAQAREIYRLQCPRDPKASQRFLPITRLRTVVVFAYYRFQRRILFAKGASAHLVIRTRLKARQKSFPKRGDVPQPTRREWRSNEKA